MCDTLIVCSRANKNGHTVFGKNSDRGCNEPQYFVYMPAMDHEEHSVKCTYISVDQVKHTNAMILSKPSWIWGAEMGINEYGVTIGNEAVYSKETNEKEALLGMDMVRLALERAKTAAEAVDVLTMLLETYGQGGNGGFDSLFCYDNSFMITDGRETYYLETAGRFWAVQEVKDRLAISNHMMLGVPDRMHKDALSHARDMGYTVREPFDFREAYIAWDTPKNVSGTVRGCSGQHQLCAAAESFSAQDMMRILRSHTTEEPWIRGDMSICKHAIRHGTDSSTTNAMVVDYAEDGSISLWGTGMSTPCVALFQPLWFDVYSHELVHDYADQEKGMDQWLHLEQINRLVAAGKLPEKELHKEVEAVQSKWMEEAGGLSKEGRQSFCDRTHEQAMKIYDSWIEKASGVPESYGNEELKAFWKDKDAALGKDRRIAV